MTYIDHDHLARMRTALLDIKKQGGSCCCNTGYSYGCGCGERMAETATDGLCMNPDKYGACGVCAECDPDKEAP